MTRTYSKDELTKIWNDFEKNRLHIEKRFIRFTYKHYLTTFKKINEQLLLGKSINQAIYFNQKWVNDLYDYLCRYGGMHFANWYASVYVKYQIKNTHNLQLTDEMYEQIFADYSRQIALLYGETIVSTATKNAIRVFKQLMENDPNFRTYGIDKKTKMLLQRTKAMSEVYAKRIAQTESTRIANYSIHRSAQTFFNQDDLVKTWISAKDLYVRETHQEADSRYSANPIPSKENFMVGGEYQMRPGSGTSAKENINCRCVSWEYPRPGSETIADVDDFGFGIGTGGFVN